MFYPRIIALIILLAAFTACQTSRLKEFDNLILGQEKDTVLEVMGNPTYRERIQDQDRWTYIVYENNIRHEKIIKFLDGFVTYRGLPIPPFISAEEQDEINSQRNLQLAVKEQMEFQNNSKGKISNRTKTKPKIPIPSENH